MPTLPKSHIATISSIDGMPPVPGRAAGHADVQVAADVSTYEAQRRGLIAEEKQRRFDAAKRARRTPAEQKADEVIRQMRLDEIRDVYDAPGKVSASKGTTWTRAKSRGADSGKLYKLIQQLPKGAILHSHLEAAVDANWLIRQTYDDENLYMRADAALTTHASIYSTAIAFRALPKEAGTPADQECARAEEGVNDNIYDQQYKPNTWVRFSKARFSFPYDDIYAQPIDGFEAVLKDMRDNQPSDSPSAVAFDSFLLSRLTFTPVPTDLSPAIVTAKEAWAFFAGTFDLIDGLQTYRTRLQHYVRSFRNAVADNVSYLEARALFFYEFFQGPDGQDTLSHVDLVNVFEEALAIVKADLPDPNMFEAKLIYTTLKFIDAERLQWYIDDAIALKQKFPNRIVGFDLVGQEDASVPLRTYVPQLLAMQRHLKEINVDLPLCLHAGETLGDGDPVDDNLFDAVLLGTKRIGHGFTLNRHPSLVEAVRQKGICIESCPISNQILRYTDTLAIHPVLSLLAYGCPVVLSHDDPFQFLNMGLSPDFYSILIASDHFDLTSLGVLARNSLEHSLVPDPKQKEEIISLWDAQWAAFVDRVASLA